MLEGSEGKILLDANGYQKGAEDGVIVGDLWGYITDVNEVIVKLFGAASRSEVVGKHVLDFLVKEERGRAIQESLDIIANDHSETKEYLALSKSGEKIHVKVTIDLIKDKQGEQIGFVDIVRVAP